MDEVKLLPCPFPHEIARGPHIECDEEEWDIARGCCGDCGACGPFVDLADFPCIEKAKEAAAKLWNANSTRCEGCPPVGYPTDKTRCLPCDRRSTRPPIGTDEVVERVKLEFYRDYPLSVGYGLSENGRDYAVRDEHFRAAADEFADRLIAAMPTIDQDGGELVLLDRIAKLEAQLNTPEVDDFARGAVLEAAHQRERWGVDHDAGKSPFDWFWLVGYLSQKAAASAVAGDIEKAKHHTISTAAALANWHLALSGTDTIMRPGIGPGNGGDKTGSAYDLATRSAPPAQPENDQCQD